MSIRCQRESLIEDKRIVASVCQYRSVCFKKSKNQTNDLHLIRHVHSQLSGELSAYRLHLSSQSVELSVASFQPLPLFYRSTLISQHRNIDKILWMNCAYIYYMYIHGNALQPHTHVHMYLRLKTIQVFHKKLSSYPLFRDGASCKACKACKVH